MRDSTFRIAALGASLAALIACSTTTPTSSISVSDSTLVVARVKDAVVLDPAQASDGNSLNLTQEVMKGLVQFKVGTFSVEPAIADSWRVSPDARTWTFVIRKGLRFSDGTPVDADAVKFNFDRWRLLSSPYHSSFGYPYYVNMFGGFPGLIADVRAPDDTSVVFTLTHPYAPFLSDLAMPAFAIGSPRAIRDDLDGFARHPVGWGPYVVSEWIKDDHITLQANPDYPVKPGYRTVIVRDIPDLATSVFEMQKGDFDVSTEPRPDDAALLAREPGLTVYYQPANNDAYLAMNEDRKPFERLAVRQAIADAVDVRSIVKAFYPRGAEVADNFLPPGMAGENSSIKAYSFDPNKAKKILAAAGYKNGFSTELLFTTAPRPYMPEPQRVAEAIQAQLKRIGINVTLEPLEWAVFLQKIHNGEHAMALVGWTGDNGDPDNFLYTLLDSDSTKRPNVLNYSFWRDQNFHKLMLAGQMTSDLDSRTQIYEQASAMVHEFVPTVPIVHVTVPIVARTSIAGFIPSPDDHIAFELLHPRG